MRETRLRKHVAMPAIPLLLLVLSAFSVAAGTTSPASSGSHEQATTKPADQKRLVESYGKLPLSFEANQGQTDPRVKFLSRGSGYTLFLTGNEAVLALRNQKPEVKSQKSQARSRNEERRSWSPVTGQLGTTTDKGQGTTDVLRMKLVGANTAAKVVGVEELPGKANYFIGKDPKKWRTDVRTYAKVKYEGVYPGIDLVYYGNDGRLEYDFVVAPGADPQVIALRVETRNWKLGAENSKLGIAANGDLVVEAESGEVRLHKPAVYQPMSAKGGSGNSRFAIQNPELIEGRYVLTAENRVTFEVANYDRSKPLVIDPVLVYSTYLGGSGTDVGTGIAVDSSGNAYVTGYTASPDFPIANAFQSTCCGTFITKFNAAGTALVYSTFLGGAGALSIAVDSSGNAYVTGNAGPGLPTVNPIQSTFAGGVAYGDAFVTKLNAAGDALVYSTYLGGRGEDAGTSIAVDSSGEAYVTGLTYVTGYTGSPDNFPTANALQDSLRGYENAFVSKLNAAGTAFVYSTYLGGDAYDVGRGIAVDSSGNAYVTGYTNSIDFPTMNPFQTAFVGQDDAFVAKLNATGTALVYSTYLGGGGDNIAFSIAVDSLGNAYVTGLTDSADFPLVNPVQSQCVCANGFTDAFVAKLNATGTALVYSTYLGGTYSTTGLGIAVDPSGDAFVTGGTQSPDFPTVNAFQTTIGNPYNNAFVTELSVAGSALVYSTYLGGSAINDARGIAVDSSGNAYVTGNTGGPGFPTVNAFQPAYNGNGDAFVAKIASTVPFASFSTKLAITAGPRPGFQMYANFSLGAGGSINPLTQPVTLQVGSYSVTIPPGSFKQLGQGSKAGNYVYSGTLNGVSLQVHIVALGNSGYVFKAAAQPVDLTGLSNPVSVTITIGNNTGTAEAVAEFERRPASGFLNGGLGLGR